MSQSRRVLVAEPLHGPTGALRRARAALPIRQPVAPLGSKKDGTSSVSNIGASHCSLGGAVQSNGAEACEPFAKHRTGARRACRRPLPDLELRSPLATLSR